MKDIDGPNSFARFLRMKWFVFTFLVLSFAYFTSILAGGIAHPNVAKWIPLTLVGAGQALLIMFLWYRLGPSAWYVLAAWFAMQALARVIQGI